MKRFNHFIHHFFIPRERNNYKAKALHSHMLSSYLLFFIAFGFFVSQINLSHDNVLGYATDISVDKLFRLTNEEREKEGLSQLKYNDQLAEAANKKANDMYTQNYWAHYAPDGSTPWSFILGSGYKYEYAGENLAKNFLFSDGVVEAWMKSPTHRENIMRDEYSEVGFAVVNGVLNGEETTLVVQMFGTPLGGVPQVQASEPDGDKAVAPAANGQQVIQTPEKKVIPAAQSKILVEDSKIQPSYSKVLYNGNLLFIVFLIVAFLLDLFVAVKLNIIHMRVGGKTLIHVLFLAFILTGLLIVANGKIL
jgi:hypothetical protein